MSSLHGTRSTYVPKIWDVLTSKSGPDRVIAREIAAERRLADDQQRDRVAACHTPAMVTSHEHTGLTYSDGLARKSDLRGLR